MLTCTSQNRPHMELPFIPEPMRQMNSVITGDSQNGRQYYHIVKVYFEIENRHECKETDEPDYKRYQCNESPPKISERKQDEEKDDDKRRSDHIGALFLHHFQHGSRDDRRTRSKELFPARCPDVRKFILKRDEISAIGKPSIGIDDNKLPNISLPVTKPALHIVRDQILIQSYCGVTAPT